MLRNFNKFLTKLHILIDSFIYTCYFYTYSVEYKDKNDTLFHSWGDGMVINVPKGRLDVALNTARKDLIKQWTDEDHKQVNVMFKTFYRVK